MLLARLTVGHAIQFALNEVSIRVLNRSSLLSFSCCLLNTLACRFLLRVLTSSLPVDKIALAPSTILAIASVALRAQNAQ